jgi:methionine sulfoxide reductase catalytic subunit
MLIRRADSIRSSEITPKDVYYNRRRLLGIGALGLATAGLQAAKLEGVKKNPAYSVDEKLNRFEEITGYNNYYEFGTGKEDPAKNAGNFKTNPWQLKVEGLCAKPKTYDLDSLRKLAPMEERVYRHRCVEAWSMIVPWDGYPLAALLKAAEPDAKAKFVAFESYYDPKQMPLGKNAGFPLPYVEGLRLDEAMHQLTMLAYGIYGEVIPNQNGAPVRLVVPWKYGFKGIKSIAKIRFTDKMPPTTWNLLNAREYGFYSNVNPAVDHPRWSQATERRIGEFFRKKTFMFNGYGDQVAGLYQGLDLKKNY